MYLVEKLLHIPFREVMRANPAHMKLNGMGQIIPVEFITIN
jgi:hypothetical protein